MTKMTPLQCTAARGLLRWTQAKLASEAHVGLSTVRSFEDGGDIRDAQALCLSRALEEAGVQFIDAEDGVTGPGVALRWGVEVELTKPEPRKPRKPRPMTDAEKEEMRAYWTPERLAGLDELGRAEILRALGD